MEIITMRAAVQHTITLTQSELEVIFRSVGATSTTRLIEAYGVAGNVARQNMRIYTELEAAFVAGGGVA